MMKQFLKTSCILFLFALSACRDPKFQYIPSEDVYDIQEYAGKLYFSTSKGKILSFPLGHPTQVQHIASFRRCPFRSIVFDSNGTCFTASYEAGLFYVDKDTLLPVGTGIAPAWSMKTDPEGDIWLVGRRGIFKGKNGRFTKAIDTDRGHDIAFWANKAVVADYYGLKFYNPNTGRMIKHMYKGSIFWRIRTFGQILIAGGKNLCVMIDETGQTSEINVPVEHNIVWDIEYDTSGLIYLATQKGLFSARIGDKCAKLILQRGNCVKCIRMDSQGVIWLGLF